MAVRKIIKQFNETGTVLKLYKDQGRISGNHSIHIEY